MTITPAAVEGVVALGNGRRLGFATFGPIGGKPVIWLHGTPGARRQIPEPARVAAWEYGVRIIGIDRPGVGLSTPHLYDAIIDFTADLEEFADQLGLEHFGLIGLSGGGPYVLASATALAHRVVAGAVLGGVAPTRGNDAAPGGVVGRLAGLGPAVAALRGPLAVALSTAVLAARPFASPGFDVYARFSPEGDRSLFARPEMKAMFLDDLLNGSKRGLRAPIFDFVLFTRHWGFDLADVARPIHWWHGDADHIVPIAHAEHVVGRLPQATLTIRPGESHLGTLAIAEEILETLLSHWAEEPARRSTRTATKGRTTS